MKIHLKQWERVPWEVRAAVDDLGGRELFTGYMATFKNWTSGELSFDVKLTFSANAKQTSELAVILAAALAARLPYTVDPRTDYLSDPLTPHSFLDAVVQTNIVVKTRS
jgi:hypothetical protein